MNLWIQKCTMLLLAAGAMFLNFSVQAEEKVQRITFIEDDAQKVMTSKIYILNHTKAADVAPFIRDAVLRYTTDSCVSTVNDPERNRQIMIVSTGVKMIPYVDAMVAALDRNAKADEYSNITGDGIAVGFYQPVYRTSEAMLDVMIKGDVVSGEQEGRIRFDRQRNMFYFKDTPATVADIKDKLEWLDKPVPQSRLVMTVYEVRDSDLLDLGIDYLAWKNGPGMNLFSVGYNALSMHVAEQIISNLTSSSIDLAGTATYGFGGFYTAPAFDISFLRIMQQHGKATLSSTASLLISNQPGKVFTVAFAPEYQNLEKDSAHASSVTVGGDASLDLAVSNAVITSGENGTVNFEYVLNNSNVVERNVVGSELTESETITASVTLPFDQEMLLATWTRNNTLEQTVGVPFLCELPVLKYIFGSTTKTTEVTRCIVTVRAVPVVYNENMQPGTVAEFDEIANK